ncbi:hypothetical protein KOAAANKH_00241 [Brevundimonas sp. NIBR10]|uniref:phosphatase PAP2 family protein n=1 Tax=Brevundimonas sp. NIBR10 TaxID=3015997 RepID=UPI0022F177CE|nr:phosphatase PAP2 family protein [Brevundimonas sp. NIBR10]WGM45379.1 hypothetical protein KOAAANKH_00241 [Brevundimonas sp. NIBR10]
MDIPIHGEVVRPDRALIAAAARRARRMLARLRVSVEAGLRPGDPVALALVAVVVLSVYFLMFPGVDLAVTAAFHRADEGFPLSGDPLLRGLRKSSTWVLAGLLVVAAVILIPRRWSARAAGRTSPGRRRNGLFLLVGLVVGPGLVVNSVLKSAWGRARPIQTDLFGGDAAFTEVWRISDACRDNCSFVSGEASSATWMVCAVLLMTPKPWRLAAVSVACVYGAALSLNRVAFGGHYLSDVLLSWAITALVLAVLHRVMAAAPMRGRRPLPVLKRRVSGIAVA